MPLSYIHSLWQSPNGLLLASISPLWPIYTLPEAAFSPIRPDCLDFHSSRPMRPSNIDRSSLTSRSSQLSSFSFPIFRASISYASGLGMYLLISRFELSAIYVGAITVSNITTHQDVSRLL